MFLLLGGETLNGTFIFNSSSEGDKLNIKLTNFKFPKIENKP